MTDLYTFIQYISQFSDTLVNILHPDLRFEHRILNAHTPMTADADRFHIKLLLKF